MKNKKAAASVKYTDDEAKNRVRIGIKLKLMGILLPIVIMVIAIIMVQVYINTRNLVIDKSEEILTANTGSVIHEVQTWMTETITALTLERDTIEYSDMDEAQMLAYVKHTQNTYDSFPAGIYIATTDGKMIHATFSPGPDFKASEKPWYQSGITSEEFTFGSVYFDEDSRSYVVGASGMLKDRAGKCTGVAAADIYLNAISDIVEDVKLGETGRTFLIDGNTNMIIGHPNEEMVGKELDEADEELYAYVNGRISEDSMGLDSFSMQTGAKMYVDIEHVPGCNWITTAYVPEKEILAELDSLTRKIAIIAVIGCIVVLILMERIIHIIVKPVKKLSGAIASVTDGDFTVDVQVDTSDEIGLMAEGVRRFISTMRNIIKQIDRVSDTLNVQAGDSQGMSIALSTAADGQAISMEEMTHTISELAASIAEVAENATSLSILVADTKEKGDMAETQIQEAVAASDHGKTDMERVTESMTRISKKMASMERCAEQMTESVKKVNDIVGMIGEIAEETNLLSLNASIEAARAGEAGRGFAVVADQIGKLAATSKASVDEIADLTNEISQSVQQTVRETKESASYMNESTERVENAGESFEQIYRAVGKTNEAVAHMIDSIREVNEIAVSVAGITQEQSAASEEILATTETVRENTNKVSSGSKEVKGSADNLDMSAKLLVKEMSRFRV